MCLRCVLGSGGGRRVLNVSVCNQHSKELRELRCAAWLVVCQRNAHCKVKVKVKAHWSAERGVDNAVCVHENDVILIVKLSLFV